MKAVGNILATVAVTIVGIGIIWSLQNTPRNPLNASGNEPQPVNPFPTFTSTPVTSVRLITPTPFPTSTPRPAPTPIPSPTAIPSWQELKSSAHRVPYSDLMRYPRDHVGKHVYLEGSAFQVVNDGRYIAVMMAVWESPDFKGNAYLIYPDSLVRPLQQDWIEVVGRFVELHTYTSAGAGLQTVPLLEAIDLRIENQ